MTQPDGKPGKRPELDLDLDAEATSALRFVKVAVPGDLCVQLHTHKILTGKSMGATVEEALRAYFARPREEEGTG